MRYRYSKSLAEKITILGLLVIIINFILFLNFNYPHFFREQPVIGAEWYDNREVDENPFEIPKIDIVTIVDMKDGYVQYMNNFGHLHSCSVEDFMICYRSRSDLDDMQLRAVKHHEKQQTEQAANCEAQRND